VSGTDVYYALLQEDGPVEWGTFVAFLLAAALWGRRALRAPEIPTAAAALAVSLFCVFVAGEEISWGQRLIGLRAPVYFLAQNAQQETNLHNLASHDVRELTMTLVLVTGLVALPATFTPGFAATLALHLWYPLPFTGELIELALGFLLLAAALPRPDRWWTAVTRTSAATFLVCVLGLAATRLTMERTGDPAAVALARSETVLLAQDFVAVAQARREAPTHCDTHVRLYRLARDTGIVELGRGRFATQPGVRSERERRVHFLDPWNQAYWMRHACDDDGRASAFLYSFGPNRRRDSGAFVIGGDDVGTYLLRAAVDAPSS
jgi:hypothetical protein